MVTQGLAKCKSGLLTAHGLVPYHPHSLNSLLSSMLQTWLGAVAFVVLALVGPGLAWQRRLGVRVDPALVLPLGFVHVAGFYWLALVAGQPWIFPASTLLLDVTLLLPVRDRALAPGPGLRGAL